MVKQINRILFPIEWLLLFIAVFAYCQFFLSYNYPFVEQFSFFRFSQEYAYTTFTQPGGLASYIASFLTQFYYYPLIGPLISALLAVLSTVLLDLSLKQISPRFYFPVLSTLPALTCIWLETDFNYYLSGTISLILSIGFWCTYMKVRHLSSLFVRLGGLLLFSWPLYYLLGPHALLSVGLCVLIELNLSDKRSLLSLLILPIAIACPVLLYHMEIGKDLFFQLLPTGYYLELLPVKSLSYYPWITVILNAVLAKVLACRESPSTNNLWAKFERSTHTVWLLGIQLIAIITLMHWGVKHYNSASNYEVKIFDYQVRQGQWMQLLQDPHLRPHQNRMHTCYQNLALSSLNLMGDKLFAFPQTGFPGLFIKWNKTVNSSTVLSDVYWQIGDVALSQEMAFEGMISSRDAVNPRLLMRLVQTNLVTGNYQVAEKYINLLADTYTYADQAETYRKMLFHDSAVRNDPELGPRKRCMQGGGLTTTEKVVEDLSLIMKYNPEYTPAFHYFGATCLLIKDIPSFKKFIEEYHQAPALTKMPIHFQEAIILGYENETDRWTELGVTEGVKKRFLQYKEALLANRGSSFLERKMANNFRDTYWYYFMFSK